MTEVTKKHTHEYYFRLIDTSFWTDPPSFNLTEIFLRNLSLSIPFQVIVKSSPHITEMVHLFSTK